MRILTLLLFACLVCGCGSPSDRYPPYFAVDDVKTLELYYLDPFARHEPTRAAKYKEQFRGWPVIGKTTVSDRDTQHAIAMALTRGLDEGAREAAPDCFDPHHGLRIETVSEVIELEVCFSCSQARFVGGPRPGLHLFSGSPQETLDRILMQAKALPLETQMVEVKE